MISSPEELLPLSNHLSKASVGASECTLRLVVQSCHEKHCVFFVSFFEHFFPDDHICCHIIVEQKNRLQKNM